MDTKDFEAISAWVVQRGLDGDSELALLRGFCERCYAAGLPLSRGVAIIDTLHPVHEGHAFFWARDKPVETPASEYGPVSSSNLADWQRSPFYYLLQGNDDELRRHLEDGEPTGFAVIDSLREEGQ